MDNDVGSKSSGLCCDNNNSMENGFPLQRGYEKETGNPSPSFVQQRQKGAVPILVLRRKQELQEDKGSPTAATSAIYTYPSSTGGLGSIIADMRQQVPARTNL